MKYTKTKAYVILRIRALRLEFSLILQYAVTLTYRRGNEVTNVTNLRSNDSV